MAPNNRTLYILVQGRPPLPFHPHMCYYARSCVYSGRRSHEEQHPEEVNITGNERDNSRFISELWGEVRPYALHLLKDLVVSLLLRVCVWSFHFVGHLMPISGWIDDFLNN